MTFQETALLLEYIFRNGEQVFVFLPGDTTSNSPAVDLRLEDFDVRSGREYQVFLSNLAVDVDKLSFDRGGSSMNVGGDCQTGRRADDFVYAELDGPSVVGEEGGDVGTGGDVTAHDIWCYGDGLG